MPVHRCEETELEIEGRHGRVESLGRSGSHISLD